MKMKMFIVAISAALFLAAVPAFAEDLVVTNKSSQWKLLNLEATKGIWNVQKPVALQNGGIGFSLGDKADNWYSIYFLTQVGDITDKTITATVALDVEAGTLFWTRSTTCANDGADAYVRLHFQKLDNGRYASTDYWWSNQDAVKLSELVPDGTITISASTKDPGAWQDINGGETGSVKPLEFADMLKAKKMIGVSFGSSCRWASGVATTGGGGMFKLLSYTVN
ncbi:MAG: hypothetical protein Q8N81_06015 [bacterium]|nr:hypothetical protein [bacterium]